MVKRCKLIQSNNNNNRSNNDILLTLKPFFIVTDFYLILETCKLTQYLVYIKTYLFTQHTCLIENKVVKRNIGLRDISISS